MSGARSTQCTHENLLTSVASVLFLGIIEFVRLLDCGDRLVEYNQARIKLVSMAFKHHLLTTCSHASRRNKRESKVLQAESASFVHFHPYVCHKTQSRLPDVSHNATVRLSVPAESLGLLATTLLEPRDPGGFGKGSNTWFGRTCTLL